MARHLTTRLYIGAVIAAGLVLAVMFAPREVHSPVTAGALLISTLVLSVFKVRLPLGNGVATLSPAHAVDFLALMIEGASLAMLLGAVGVLIQCTVRVRRRQPIHRAAFSAAAVVIAVQFAGLVWRGLGGEVDAVSVTGTLLPLAACAVACYLVNTALVVGAIAVTHAVPPAHAWDRTFWWCAPAYAAAAIVAAIAAFTLTQEPVVTAIARLSQSV